MESIERSNISVLIVEDEVIVSTNMRQMLEKRGYKVVACCVSGEQAIDFAAEYFPDLVIMDINLASGMSGMEAAEYIYQNYDIPIVYLTAHSDDLTVNKAMSTEPFAYILKPVDDINLDVVVRLTVYKNRVFREIKKNEAMLRALSGQIDTVREEERKKISREIHDELGQYLTALKIDLFWIRKHLHEPESVDKKIDSMLDVVSSSIHTVQRISRELRPDVLDNLPFNDAVDYLINEFSQRSEADIQFEMNTKFLLENTDKSVSLYRFLQEALNNVMRHAQAAKILVTIEDNEDSLIITVIDDGKGVNQSDITSIYSFGITGMRERIIKLGGQFSINNRTGSSGTEVRAVIPGSSFK